MRTAVPLSLITVGLVRADTDRITVIGPFSSVRCMDSQMIGKRFPDDGDPTRFEFIAEYRATVNRWYAADGTPLVMVSVTSVDDAMNLGCAEEQRQARFIFREFPPEPAVAAKEG